MLNQYGKGAIIGSFDTYDKDTATIHLDFNRYYTSILKNIKKIPVVNSFDNFVDYKGEELEDFNIYFVQKTNSNICYPHNMFSLCFGMNLKDVSGIKIISHLRVSKLKENIADGVIKKIYEDDTLTDKMKKDLFNHLIGNYNKKSNKNTFSCMSNNEEECNAVIEKYGGRKIPLKLKGQPMFLNYVEKETELSDGFKLISMLIYDISHKKLFQLKESLENESITVYGANTDCLYIEKDFSKLKQFKSKNIELFEFKDKNTYEALGKLKIDTKSLPERNIVQMRHLYNYYESVPEVQKKEIKLKNEWDCNEINYCISNNNRLIIKADIAGAGKTFSFINYAKQSNKKMLFVCPWNSLKFDLIGKGMDAITLDNLKGLRFNGEDTSETNRTYDVSSYDCIVFDEIYLHDTYKLSVIRDFMAENKDKTFFATGDENQNKPIETLAMKKKKEYYNSIVSSMFPNSICLHDNKRCTSKEDQAKMKLITKMIRNAESKEELMNILLTNFQQISKPEDIKTLKNVVALNATASWVNGLIHEPIDNEVYYEGLELICKQSLKFGKIRSCVNGTYQIINIEDDVFTLTDWDNTFDVSKEMIKAHFSLPYARTCHSYQGMSEDEALTIFDIQHFMVDNDWVYTAITRATSLSQIYIYTGSYPYQDSLKKLKWEITKRIDAHKTSDALNDKPFFGKYVSVEWVLKKLKKCKMCKFCNKHFDASNPESFSIDRKDNNIGHIEMNCQIICRRCNVSKK